MGKRSVFAPCSGAAAVIVAVLLIGGASAVDPLGIAAFPQSQPQQQSEATEATSHDLILGSVDRVGGSVRVDEQQRVQGRRSAVTYEAPRGSELEEVIGFYRDQLLAEASTRLHECRGRDCGRSNLWANEIFEQSILYGPDRDQFYLATMRDRGEQGEVLTAYVVQRANDRIYAHLEQIVLTEPLGLDMTALAVDNLRQQGFAVLAELPHDLRGDLPPAVREEIAAFAAALDGFTRGSVHLVCHLYGVGQVADLLERADACAREARAILDPEERLGIEAHGAGPLAPRNGRADSRIELIIPERLERG